VTTALLEIVDLGNGEVVLQRADDRSTPLLRLEFSKESRAFIMDQCLEVARVMIQAGLQASARISEQIEVEEEEPQESAPVQRTVH
jgi:hypothetical protein